MNKKRFTVTSALLYANGPIHLGHVSGAYLPADIFVRYQKLKENDVAFISGSDEHGAAITLQAKKEGVSPKEIIDKYDALNKKTFADFGIDFSIYHRTSSDKGTFTPHSRSLVIALSCRPPSNQDLHCPKT